MTAISHDVHRATAGEKLMRRVGNYGLNSIDKEVLWGCA